MTTIKCLFPECVTEVTHEWEAVAIVMFKSHMKSHQQPVTAPQGAPSKQRLPKIDRPELKQDISYEDWATFESEWKRFKRCAKWIPPRSPTNSSNAVSVLFNGFSSRKIATL